MVCAAIKTVGQMLVLWHCQGMNLLYVQMVFFIYFFPSQNETKIITGKDGLPISSKAVNVSWLGKDILFCKEHSVKLFQLDHLTIIAGQGDTDAIALKIVSTNWHLCRI